MPPGFCRKSWNVFVFVTQLAVLSALIVELFLFLFEDSIFRRSFYGFDPDIGFRVRAHAQWGPHRANRFGFNDEDYELSKPAGETRVIILGDSFNWSGGLSGNVPARVRELLQKDEQLRHITCINAGYPMTHPGESLKILTKYAVLYEPDWVYMAVYAGNDFYDADPNRHRVGIGGSYVDVDLLKFTPPVLFNRAVLPKSRFVLLAKDYWMRRHYTIQHRPLGSGETPSYSDEYLGLVADRMEFLRRENRQIFSANIQYVYDSLAAMEQYLSGHGIGMKILIYPAEFQVSETLRKIVLDRTGRSDPEFQWDLPQALIRDFSRDHGVPMFDLLPVFLDATRAGVRCYRMNDPHWNTEGNSRAAAAIFSWMQAAYTDDAHP